MRGFGYAVVDALVEQSCGLAACGPGVKGRREELEALFREPPPEQGAEPADVLRQVTEGAFRSMVFVNHPRFFAFVPSPGNFIGAMADALASGYNAFVGTWFAGSGPAEIELVTVDWLRQICGLPESGGGLFVSGGSVANLTALAVARHARIGYEIADAAAYFSDQTHSSVERAFSVLGFAPAQMRRLPADENFRLSMAALEAEVARDRALGRRPFCVVANAGTTNTGAVDPLAELAGFCRREGLWLHVDGAYGAAAAVTQEGRALLVGLGEADSVTLDPHKWLFQPFEIGCVLVRDADRLKSAFRILPEYLRDVHRFREEVNFCDYGIQLSRGFRALKLWMTLKVFGLDAVRKAIARGIRLAEVAGRRLRERPEWEIVTPAQLAIVSFRYVVPGRTEEEIDILNGRVVEELLAEGFAVVTSTVLRGRTALRLCTINPRTTEDDITETISRMERIAEHL